MIWFSSPVKLQGSLVSLIPLETAHFQELIKLTFENAKDNGVQYL